VLEWVPARPGGLGRDTNQVGQIGVRQDVADTSRIREFLRMNPSSFTGSSFTEDPENFVEDLQKVFEIMHVTDIERAELVAYQLKGVVKSGLINGRRVEQRVHRM